MNIIKKTILTCATTTSLIMIGAGSASAASIVITNAGFETDSAPATGATGWTITSGGTDWFTATSGLPDSAVDPDVASEGSNWLSGNRLHGGAGSSNNPQTIGQLIDLTTNQTEIIAGIAILDLNWMFSDNDSADDATVAIRFYSDVAGTIEIGSGLTTGTIAETASQTWDTRNLSGAVPANALSMYIEMENNRSSGSAGNVHFDDFSGNITAVAVPEPSTSGLLALGGLALILHRKK